MCHSNPFLALLPVRRSVHASTNKTNVEAWTLRRTRQMSKRGRFDEQDKCRSRTLRRTGLNKCRSVDASTNRNFSAPSASQLVDMSRFKYQKNLYFRTTKQSSNEITSRKNCTSNWCFERYW